MTDELRLVRVEQPVEADSAVVREGLARFNRGVLGLTRRWPVVFHLLRDGGGFVGAVTGGCVAGAAGDRVLVDR